MWLKLQTVRGSEPMQKVVVSSVVLALALFAASLSAQTTKELRVSAIPDENPQEMLRIYAPFAEYLTKEVGIPVKFIPVVDYAATVEGLAANRLEMVWYGGLTSVQAARQAKGARRIIMRKEDAEFKSHFITRKDTGIKDLKDLKGKTFAFGSVSSTSGHLMPRYFLLQSKVNPEKDMKQVAFSGAHDATALWVESGRVDAGALNFLVWDKLVQQKKVDLSKVNVFYTTPPYVDYCWTVRGDLDAGLQDKITAAFLKLNYDNPEHRRLLDLHRTRKYLRASDADWKPIEEAAVAAGLPE